MNKILDKKNNLKEGEMIKLCYDEAFKIMYANEEHLEILTMLLSKILQIDYKLLEGNVTLLPLKSTNKTIDDVKVIIDDWIDYYNNERYQWDLAKLSPTEYYKYITTGEYPIKSGKNKIPSS